MFSLAHGPSVLNMLVFSFQRYSSKGSRKVPSRKKIFSLCLWHIVGKILYAVFSLQSLLKTNILSHSYVAGFVNEFKYYARILLLSF